MFNTLPLLPVDPILGLVAEFDAMIHPDKVNLGVGIYLDEQGKSTVFKSVVKAEESILEQKLNKSYFPIQGDSEFLKLASKIVFGEHLNDPAIVNCQAVGGTSALSLAGRFLYDAGYRKIYLPTPTWPNHPQIFKNTRLEIVSYEYPSLNGLENIDTSSVLLVHACCHNPTGIDLSKDKWKELFNIAKTSTCPLLFDNAYQGLGVDLEEDAWAIREAIKMNLSLLVATSFSKNFGLYGERVGLLSVKVGDSSENERFLSYLKSLVRTDYSNPPLQGARIVKTILASPALKSLWMEELNSVRTRLTRLRDDLAQILPHVKSGHGLFALSGFTEEMVLKLKEKHGCLMPKSGRINVAGLNAANFDRVKAAFLDVM